MVATQGHADIPGLPCSGFLSAGDPCEARCERVRVWVSTSMCVMGTDVVTSDQVQQQIATGQGMGEGLALQASGGQCSVDVMET